MRTKTLLGLIGAVALAASNVCGAVLFDEQFNYSNGDLTTVSGGLWVNHSGTGELIQVFNGAAVTVQGSGSREDANRSAGAVMTTGDTWYAGFDVTVTGGSANVYFAHLKDDGTDFGARVFVTPFGGADFTFGLSDANSTPDVALGTGLTFGTTYRVVTAYDFDTGLTQLWLNPTSIGDTSISLTGAAGADFSAYALRQSTGDSVQTIGNLILATTFSEAAIPEPGTVVLVGIGLTGLLWGMRRRRAA